MNKPNRQTVKNTAMIATGVFATVAVYQMGYSSGAKLDSMLKDLVAHQLLIVRLRAENPELVDLAINETVTQLSGIITAAN